MYSGDSMKNRVVFRDKLEESTSDYVAKMRMCKIY